MAASRSMLWYAAVRPPSSTPELLTGGVADKDGDDDDDDGGDGDDGGTCNLAKHSCEIHHIRSSSLRSSDEASSGLCHATAVSQ